MKHLERALDGQNKFGKYVAMTLIIFLGASTIGSIPLMMVMVIKWVMKGGSLDPSSVSNMMNLSWLGISNNLSYFLMLLAFVATFFAFKWLVKPFHKRTLNETINGRAYIRKDRIGAGILVWGVISAIMLIIGLLTSPEEYEYQFNPGAFIPLVLITVIVMPFQTSFEEIFFRGYLSQGVAAWTKSRWWTLVIIALLFGLMHVANPEVKEFGFWLSMPQYIIMGLLLGLISILDDGIELALGIHFANNAFSALFLTYESSVLQTDAVFKTIDVHPETDTFWLIIAAIITVLFFKRRYKWDFRIMNKKVEVTPPPVPEAIAE